MNLFTKIGSAIIAIKKSQPTFVAKVLVTCTLLLGMMLQVAKAQTGVLPETNGTIEYYIRVGAGGGNNYLQCPNTNYTSLQTNTQGAIPATTELAKWTVMFVSGSNHYIVNTYNGFRLKLDGTTNGKTSINTSDANILLTLAKTAGTQTIRIANGANNIDVIFEPVSRTGTNYRLVVIQPNHPGGNNHMKDENAVTASEVSPGGNTDAFAHRWLHAGVTQAVAAANPEYLWLENNTNGGTTTQGGTALFTYKNSATNRYFAFFDNSYEGGGGQYINNTGDNNRIHCMPLTFFTRNTGTAQNRATDARWQSASSTGYTCASASTKTRFRSLSTQYGISGANRSAVSEFYAANANASHVNSNSPTAWCSIWYNLTEVAVKPIIYQTAATTITATSATLNGNADWPGGKAATVTARGFWYSTSSTFDPVVSTAGATQVTSGSGTGTFNSASSVTGLAGGTTYYAYAYATNSAGTQYSTGITFTTTSNPIITLDHTGIAQTTASNISQGSTDNILSNFRVNVTTANATLNTVAFTGTGNFVAGDIANFKLYTNTSATLSGATLLSTVTATSLTGTSAVSFTGLTQATNIGDRYFFITADVGTGATPTKTVIVPVGGSSPNLALTFATGTVTNNITVGGTKTIIAGTPIITLDHTGIAQTSAGNITQGAPDNILSNFRVNVATADAVLDNISFTAGGSFVAGDLTNFKLYTNTSATLSGATLLSTVAATSFTGGISTVDFLTLNQPCVAGNRYFFITADVEIGAAIGNTVIVPATPSVNFATGSVTNNITIGGTKTIAAAAPVINLNHTGIAQTTASNITQGSTDNILSNFVANVTIVNATLNTLSFTGTGNFVAGDISNFKLYTNTSATLSGATLLSTVTATGLTGTSLVTFSGLNQLCQVGTPQYFFITADVGPGATLTRTVIVPATPTLTFASGNVSNNITVGGTKTITAGTPVVTLSHTGIAQVSAGNIAQGSTDNILSNFRVSVATANATLNTIAFTGTGNFAAGDINNYKLYVNTSATLSGATLLSTVVATSYTGTTAVSFGSLTQSVAVGADRYFFITADVGSPAAAIGKTVQVPASGTAPALVVTFASPGGAVTSGVTVGGAQTIVAGTPTITLDHTGMTQTTSGTIRTASTDQILSNFRANVSVADATLNSISFTIGGTFVAGDLTNLKLYTSTGTTFPGGAALSTVSATTFSGGSSTVTFSGLTQAVAAGNRYFWITTDVASGAVTNNTVIVPATPTVTFALGTPTNNITVGGTKTIVAFTNYYSKSGTTNANEVASWTTDPTGALVSPPASFLLGDKFTVRAGQSMTVNGSWTVSGGVNTEVIISSTATITQSNSWRLDGAFTNNGTFNNGNNTFTMGTNGSINGTATITFNNFIINTTSASDTVKLNKSLITLQNGGVLTLTQGVFKVGSANAITLGTGGGMGLTTTANGNFATTGTNGSDGGTLNIAIGSGNALTVNGAAKFYNLLSTGDGNWRLNLQSAGAIINGTLTVTGSQSNQFAVQSNSPIWGAASTFSLNKNGQGYTPGFEWVAMTSGTIGTTAGYPNNVTLMNMGNSQNNGTGFGPSGTWSINGIFSLGNGTTAGLATFQSMTSFTCSGIVIDNGSTLKHASEVLTVKGNWRQQGATVGIFAPTTATPAAVIFGGTGTSGSPQTISISTGTVTFGSAGNFAGLTINNNTYVKLNSPVTLGTTRTLTLTSGILETDATNLLTIQNTAINGASGGMTGGSTTAYINGPVRWNLPSGTPGQYIFHIGKTASGGYLPFAINPTASGTTTATVEAFNTGAAANGQDGTSLTAIGSEYWQLTTATNFTSGTVGLGRTTALGNLNSIGKSTTQATGSYSYLGGTVGTINSQPAVITSNNVGGVGTSYLALAEVATFTITVTQTANGTIAPSTIVKNYGTNQAFTITPDPCFGIASVTVDGSPVALTSPYTFTNITAAHTITATYSALPPHTITLSSAAGTDNQNVCASTAVTNITYAIGGGATGAGVTGLPAGVTGSYSAGVFTISGTSTVAGTYNYIVTTTGNTCTQQTGTGTIIIKPIFTYGNLETNSGTICQTGTYDIYGQVFATGITVGAGIGANVEAQFGYFGSNTNPSTWGDVGGNWTTASYNGEIGNNDQFKGTFSSLAPGTYFYTFRYRLNGCQWQYAGYNTGFWDGSTNTNRQLTVNATTVAGTAVATPSSVCLGSTTALSLSGTTASAYQWQRSTTNGTFINITGATSSTYTSSPTTVTTYYRALVTSGVCTQQTSATATVSITDVNIMSANGSGSWNNGDNDNVTGFGPWALSTSGATGDAGFFRANSTGNDAGNTVPHINTLVTGGAYGIYAYGGKTGSAVTDITGNLSIGQAIGFSMDNGSIQSTTNPKGTVGMSLQNASGNSLAEVYFRGGDATYTVNDNAGATLSTIPFTRGGIEVYMKRTGTVTYDVKIVRKEDGVSQTLTGRTFSNPAGGQVPAKVRFFNYSSGNNLDGGSSDDYNFYVNHISITNPVITTQPSTTPQSICIGGSSTSLSVVASGAGLTYQWFSNASAANSGGTNLGSANGAQTATFTPQTSTANTLYYYVVVTGSCATATSAVSGAVTINALPTASISGNNGPICSGSTATFNLTGTSGAVVTYNINGGSTATVTLTGGTGSVSLPNTTSAQTLNLVSINHPITTCSQSLSGSSTVSLITYNITVTAGLNGSITPGTGAVTCGTNQTYTITPATGYHVVNVVVDGSSQGAITSYQFTNVTATHTISATFAINVYTITASAGSNGVIDPDGVTNVNYGGSVVYTITPDGGYHVEDVLVDGGSIGAVTDYTFSNVTTDHTIDVTFASNCSGYTFTNALNDYDYTNGANWECGIAPSPTEGADIMVNPDVVLFLGEDFVLGNITFSNGSSIDMNGYQLTINGAVSGPGTFTGSSASNLIIGGDAGTLNFTEGANTIHNLTLEDGSSATLGSPAYIAAGTDPGTVIVNTGATLNTGGNLIIGSNLDGTARVGESAGDINGAVTVERYTRENTYRGWRLLAVPVNGNSQTIRQSWQEGATSYAADPNPGYGTRITANTGNAVTNGFDAQTFGNSLLQYDGVNWQGFTGNLLSTSVSRGSAADAWMLYIRGNRTVDTAGVITTPTETILRAKGDLYQAPYPTVTIPANTNGLVGNILPSEIDFLDVNKNGGADDAFYVWDPQLYGSYGLGAYQTFSANTPIPWKPVPGGGSYGTTPTTKIQSGMGFFVHATGSQGTIQLTEASKSEGTNSNGLGFRPTAPAAVVPYIETNLYAAVT
ncbi:MAG: hypothetical protein V4556_10775, partial [Bacteroidota bacterium]